MMDSSCDEIQEHLHAVLEERDRLFPKRNQQNDDEMHKCLDRYVDCLDKKRAALTWEPDKRLADAAIKISDQAVFLCGPMKSGTTLLLQLLDGHKALNVLPGDSWLFVRFSQKAKQEVFSVEEWRKHWLKRYINPTGQYPFWTLGEDENNYIRFSNYIDYWFATLPEQDKRPVLTTVLSYFCANPKSSLNTKKWVEKTPGNEFKVAALDENFPQAKFIHIVRDPRENIASIKKLHLSRSWPWRVRETARSLIESYDAAIKNLGHFGEKRYLVVRYEDLTANPKEIMKKIAAFLGVDWDDSLLVPTVNSQFAKANSMYKDREVTGVVRRSDSSKWRQELSLYERGVIYQTRSYANKVGYSWPMNLVANCYRMLFRWSLLKS